MPHDGVDVPEDLANAHRTAIGHRTSIRSAVPWRKVSFGAQSGSGARFAGAMLTVGATCRMHGLDLFAYLAGVCSASMAGLAVPQLLPAPRLIPGGPGRGRTSHLVRVPS